MIDFLTPKELAQRWGLCPGTLANWRYKDKGPGFHSLGWAVIYPKKEIQKYEKANPWLIKGKITRARVQ